MMKAKIRDYSNNMYKRFIRGIMLVSEYKVLLLTYLYLIITLFSPSHKIVFILSALYFLLLFFLTGSIINTIFYSFYPFWLFRVGRDFVFEVVPKEGVASPLYWGEGRSLGFVFSPFFILVATSLVIYFFIILKDRLRFSVPVFVIFFLITYVLHFLSAINSPYLGGLSLIYTIHEFSFLIWMLIGLSIFKKLQSFKKNKILTTLLLILFGMLILESSVVFLQVAKRSVLGLKVEKVASIPYFRAGAEESGLSFRPVGLSYHPNELANWYVAAVFAIFLLWYKIKDTIPKNLAHFLIVSSATLSLVVILLTLSRSAYLALFITIVIFWLFDRANLIKSVKFLSSYLKNFKVPILLIFIYFSFILPGRIYGSLYSFSETGGLKTRLEQLKEALNLIRSPSFLTGVGEGMYIPALYDFNPQGNIRFFPEDIHNGFLLFLAERGIVAFFIYLVAIYFLLRSIIKYEQSKTVRLLMIGGLISNYIMMLFQPFINTLPLNLLITGLLLKTKKI